MSDDAVIATVMFGCLFGGPMLWGIAHCIASEWRKVRIAEQNAVLKRDMIERGFTADDIVQVLAAGSGAGDRIAGTTPQPAGQR
jgi:hypothetical protein